MLITIRTIALAALTVQNTLQTVSMRYSRLPWQPRYLTSTAVVLAEVTKLTLSMAILSTEAGPAALARACASLLSDWRETAQSVAPALLYVVQNNLLYVAVSNLDAGTYQVTYQLKLLTTAVFSMIILGRQITRRRWAALLLLFGGVTLVQIPSRTQRKAETGAAATQSAALGVAAAVAAATLSGLAGVWLERVVKRGSLSVSARNIQLGVPSLLMALAPVLAFDWHAVVHGDGFFQGHGWPTVLVVATVAVGGLLNGLVHRYSDNVAKGFATSLSIVFSSVASWCIPAFDFTPSIGLVVGSILVTVSTLIYATDAPYAAAYTPSKRD